jgi:hypothetical protein
MLLLVLSSCRKKDNDVDDDTLANIDNAHAEAVFGDVLLLSDEVGYRNGAFNGVLSSPCVTVMYDSINSADEDTVTVDFGTINCVCNDDNSRRGKLIIKYAGSYTDSGAVHTVTMQNYYFNDAAVNGSSTVTSLGPDSISGNARYSAATTGGVTLITGGYIAWNSNKQIEWYSGAATPAWEDNEYRVTGTASGTQSTGRPFIAQISTPLIRKLQFGCRRNYVSGQIEVKPTEMTVRPINFGDGACDNVAAVSIDDNTYQVTLR